MKLLDKISIEWCIDDVKSINDTLENWECREILQMVLYQFDASIGINWDIIESAIDQYLSMRGK